MLIRPVVLNRFIRFRYNFDEACYINSMYFDRKTVLKGSTVSSNENVKLRGKTVCKLRLREFTIQ